MSHVVRIAVWIGCAAAAIVMLCGIAFWGLQTQAHPRPPAAHYPRPRSEAEAQLQDLDRFGAFLSMDRSFTAEARARAEAMVASAETALRTSGALQPAAFDLLVAKMAALTDNGHSGVNAGARSRRYNRTPVRFFAFASSYGVVRARAPNQDLLGAELIAVNGRPIAAVEAQLLQYASGRGNFRRLQAPFFLESPDLLFAAGLATSPTTVSYTLRLASGDIIQRAVSGDPPDEARPRVDWWRPIAPAAIPGEGDGWTPWLRAQRAPLTLAFPDDPFPPPVVIGNQDLYLQMRANASDGPHKISAFITAAERAISAHRPRAVVLDLRWNSGGDYTTTAGFMSRLPRLLPPGGRIYALTGPRTFSAGISSLGFLKQSSPGRVRIVGDAVGDRMVFFGEPTMLELPNSHIQLSIALGLHDYLHGCAWFGPCYWVNWIFPIATPSLDPDLAAPFELKDLAGGRDPAIEVVMERERDLAR